MSEMKSRMDELFYREPFYRNLLDDLKTSVYIFDAEGRFVFLNKTAENFEGLKSENVRGIRISEIYMHPDYSPSMKALETGEHVIDNDNAYILKGKRFRQVVNAYPVFENDQVIGVYTIQTDITSIEKMVSENIDFQRKTGCAQKNVEFSSLVGEDSEFLECIEMASSTAQNDCSVLISGATGTGKEVFAKGIHNASKRKNAPFLAINCGAIPETLLESILFGTEKGAFTGAVDKKGLFEQAKGGTIFLDELNSMPLESQVKLLRVLEEKEIRHVGGGQNIKTDVRIISAMNMTPSEAISSKHIREDLFYRLSVINIIIPPLSKRGNDVFLLSRHFIDKYNKKFEKQVNGLDEEVKSFFRSYEWPGNVRQLKHTIESAMSLVEEGSKTITMKELPQYLFEDGYVKMGTVKRRDVQESPKIAKAENSGYHINNDFDVYKRIRNKEKDAIIKSLIECNGNVSKTAEILNMHRQSLIYKMKKYGIKRNK